MATIATALRRFPSRPHLPQEPHPTRFLEDARLLRDRQGREEVREQYNNFLSLEDPEPSGILALVSII